MYDLPVFHIEFAIADTVVATAATGHSAAVELPPIVLVCNPVVPENLLIFLNFIL